MLKHKIKTISHVYLKSSNFKGVGKVNQSKSIYKILKRGEEGSKKIKGVRRPWLKGRRGVGVVKF